MRSLPLVLASLTALVALGCAGSAGPEPSYPSAPSSGYSTSVGSAVTSGDSPVPTATRTSPSDFIVRPDTLQIAFVLTDRGADPQAILADLKARAETIAQSLKAAAGTAVASKMCGASTSAIAGSGKSAEGAEEAHEYLVRVDGSIEITLAPEQDYWARSQSIAALVKATIALHAATRTPEKTLSAGFSEPRPIVKDADKYRPKLLERWTQRARELAAAAQSDKAPLAIVDCTPPGDVDQRVVSLEEIALTLPVSCKLSTLRAAP